MKLIWMTPPLRASATIISSDMLRGWEQRARQAECEAITGARLVSMTSQNVLSETCDTSTIIPRSFSVVTTFRPNAVRPLVRAGSLAESAHVTFTVCVRVR